MMKKRGIERHKLRKNDGERWMMKDRGIERHELRKKDG